MQPFRYEGKVVRNTAYGKSLESVIAADWELGHASRLKAQKDPKQRRIFWHDHADCNLPGELYQSRFGDNWKDYLPKGFTEVYITVITYHVISEGNRLFVDTPFSNT